MSFTKQETFDIVARHLLTQAKQSKSSDAGGCAYRGDGGLKCAIGAIIPDDQYFHGMEGDQANSKVVGSVLKNLGHDVDFCQDLQEVHDLELGAEVGDWPELLRKASTKHCLSSAIVDELEPSFREKLAASK